MGHSFKYDDALRYAIEHDEMHQLMRGEGRYEYQDRYTNGPVDYAGLVLNVYRLGKQNPQIINEFLNELENLNRGTIDDVCMCVQYIVMHLSWKEDKENTFDFDIDVLLKDASAAIELEKENIPEVTMKRIAFLNDRLQSRGIKWIGV